MNDADAESRDLPAPGRRQQVLVLSPLVLLLVVFGWLLVDTAGIKGGPSGQGFSSDFSMFYSAARMLHSGHNPYDHNALFAAQRTILQRQGLAPSYDRSLERVGNPPLFFWAMDPLARLGFRQAGWLWTILCLLLALAGFAATAWWLGWRRLLLPGIAFVLMPPVALGIFYGNATLLVFAGLSLALLLQPRYPSLAGVLLAAAWLKPSVAIPLALLVVLFHSEWPRRVAAGFVAASIAGAVATVLATSFSTVGDWLHGLSDYARDIGKQPEIATLGGLYDHWAPAAVRTAAGVLLLCLVAGVTAYVAWQYRRERPVPMLRVAWLWFAWFLATPYAHIDDVVLLSAPILALVGHDGYRAAWRLPAISLYLLFSLLVLNRLPHLPIDLEPIKLLAIMVCLAIATKDPRYVELESGGPQQPYLAPRASHDIPAV